MKTRCKFMCISKTMRGTGESAHNSFEFAPVVDGSAEDKSFWKWTPSGKLEFQCTNPDVDFEPGKAYFLDISEA